MTSIFSIPAPISVFIHPQNQMADIGGSVSIECVVSGGPVKSMKWFKDGKMIEDFNGENNLKTLTIALVRVESVGMYQSIPPKLTKTFKSLTLKPGETLILHCSASGDPLPTILWKIRDLLIEESGVTHIQSAKLNGVVTSTLSISGITSSNGGFYKCEAVNKISKTFHTELIQVYGPPKKTTEDKKRMEEFQNGSFAITSVYKKSDDGKYKCKAENEQGLTSIGTGYLKVIEKPVIMPLWPNTVVKAGGRHHSGNYSCQAKNKAGTVSDQTSVKIKALKVWWTNPMKHQNCMLYFKWYVIQNGMLILSNDLFRVCLINKFHEFIVRKRIQFLFFISKSHNALLDIGYYYETFSSHEENKFTAQKIFCPTHPFYRNSPTWNKKPKATYMLSLSTNIEIPCSGNGYPMPNSYWSKVIGMLCIDISNFTFSFMNQFERVAMKCQVQTNGLVKIVWNYGSTILSSSTNSRVEIKYDVNSTDSTSTLIIKNVRIKDSGFYICKAQKSKISNSTRFYLSVEGSDEEFKQGTYSNRSKDGKEHVEYKQNQNFTSSSVKDNFQLYGVAMLYIIPTVTAAIVLLVILIIVCFLLHGQQKKRKKSRNQEMEMRKSWKDQEKDLNGYEYRTSDKRSSLPKSSETYYEIAPNKRISEDQYQFYSQMSSSTCNPDSSSITPYATFRSCTDPVPPIPSCTYPSIYCDISGTGPVFILEPQHSLTFLNHKGAIINCLVHGDPDPIITWVESNGNKQEKIPGYLKILRNNSLVFLPFITGNYRQEIHANSFRCKATNRFGTVVSNLVNVKALVDQHYSTQVYDEYIIEGNTAVFKCHIPSYVKDFVEVNAWIRDDHLRITKLFKKDSRYYITGNGNLHVTNVKANPDSNSIYKCETKHKISGKTTISDHGAELHITELSGSIPPKIIDIAASIGVSAGKSTILPCVSQSNPSPSYRKEKETNCKKIDISKRKDWTSINEGSLFIVAQKNDSGTYICSASNEMGKEDAVTKVTVFSPISVFIHPQTQMVDIGSSVIIECVVSGGPVKSMQWFKNGKIIKDVNVEHNLKTLTIAPVKVESVGMYQCFVENQMEAKQASAQITLSAIPPKLTKTFKSLRLKPGETLNLHCSASGDPLPTILWKVRDLIVQESGVTRIQSDQINGEITSTLSISGITSSNGGFYKCEAVNKISNVFHTELIQVYGPPKVWPISNITVVDGGRVMLHCHVSGYPIKEISWFKGRKQLKSSKEINTFKNGSLVIISANKQSDEGKYKCKAENEQGLSSIGAGYLKVIEKPVMMPLLRSAVVKAGGRLYLHCSVSEGDPPITFSWLFNGLPLPHSLDLTIADAGFSSFLTSVNVNRAHSGNYSCHAKNKAGTVYDQTNVKIKGSLFDLEFEFDKEFDRTYGRYSPFWIKKPKATYIISVSTTIEIPCSGNGYPNPKSYWSKIIGEDILELKETERMKVTDVGSLIIHKITHADFENTFVCSVSNGISPDLQQQVQFSKQNAINFINLQNNFSSKQFERVTMKCQVQTNGPVSIRWKHGSKMLSSSLKSRFMIQSGENSTGKISTLMINRVKLEDSGFYICIAQKEGISNSTRFYLSVDGINYDTKQDVPSNRSKGANVENSQTHNYTSSSVTDHFQLYGVALLYIIPTVTAAIVLLVILIIVCFLLHGQQRKRKESSNQKIEMRKSWRDQEKDINSYEYRPGDKRCSLAKSSETYYEIQPNKRFSEDQYQFYSQISSTNNPDSSSITPYATFRSCTDPVPPIPSSTYPSIYCNIRGTGPVFILEPPHTLTFLNHKGAIINCLVHGDPDPIVTWVENNGNKQENIPGYLEILRNNSLVFLPFNTGNYRQEIHASNFRCKATNRFGTIVSNIVKVKALVDQHYSTQVYNEYIIEGNTAVFKCHIPSYVKDFVEVNAWIRDDQLRINSRYYITDNGNLHVTNVKSEQDSNSMYKCETKHKISGKTTISDHGAELHITELSGSIPPKIIDISASISVSAGKTAILPCVSQSNPSPSYSWCLRNEDDSSCKEIDLSKRKDWTSINEGSLLIVARKNDSGTYICSASNEMGKEDAVTKITVFSPISVFIHPQNQMVDIGSSISIECVVSGGPVKSMQWFKDGNILKDYDAENILKTLTIDPVKVESVGMYQCFVENQMEVKQASAQITLSAIPPKISKTFKSLRLKPGETLTLHCSASGDPLPTILWKIRDSIVEESGMTHIQSEEINGEVTSTLSVSGITNSDGGIYKCEAVNKISKAFHTEIIQVYGPPKVWPISNKTVIKGDRVVLHCHVSGYPIKAISWFKGRRQLKTSKRMENFQNGSLGINSVNKESDEGKYKCRAENEHGFNSIGTGYLRVIDKPVIMPLSPSAVFKSGGRLNLHCFVSEGDPPIKFSWLLNGLTLPHSLDLTIANTGFSSSLTGMNVNRAHFGNYSCHAKNKAGTVSDQTSVKIKDSPIWSQKPKATYVLSLSSKIEVPCSGNGYPMPKSSWTKVIGEDILEVTETERIRVTDAGSLIINKITQEDFGDTLVCSVNNGINPDLQQHVQFSKQNAIKFINLQNNFSSKQFERVAMKCQVQTNGPVTISWKYGSKFLSSSTNSRYVIQSDENPTGKTLTLIINRVKLKDSGFYICIAEKEGISNSTRFYLSVDGIKVDIKQEVSPNRSKGAKGQLENSQTHNFTSSSENDRFQLYGVALLYIIPTVTAAIVLCVILIVVCILLHGQQRKRKKSRNQEMEMRKSWKDHEKDLNSYDYRTSDKRTSLSKSSETYYELRPNKHLSDDQYNFYSQMSSANYNTGAFSQISGTGPVFILEPKNSVSFMNSRGVVINCLVHGDPDPSVTWITSKGDTQRNIPQYLEILKNNSMVFFPFSTGNYQQNIHATDYRCKASNKYGVIVSNVVNVKAIVDQQYSTQVYDEYIIEGNTAVFRCHIPSYVKDFVEVNSWIRNDHMRIERSYVQGSRFYIADSGNLHVVKVNSNDDLNSVYRCETKHEISGKLTVSENGARLHITALSSSIPPKIVDIASNIDVLVGETAILPCVSQAYPPPTYSWCLQNIKDGSCKSMELSENKGWTVINEGSVSLTAKKNDSGTYICKATNEMGQEEAVSKVTVISPISVFIHPQIQIVNIGDTVNLECVVSGGPINEVTWMKNGETIIKDKNYESSKVLKISSVEISSVGMYQCFVGNQMEIKQASAQLALSAIPPKLLKKFKTSTLKPGSRLMLHCLASGDPLPKIVWKVRDINIRESRKISILTEKINGDISSTLSISEVSNTDGGIYTCEAVNKVIKVSHSQMINVYGPPFVWSIANKTSITGSRVFLQCHVSGYPIDTISWFKGIVMFHSDGLLNI
ncbi:Down syndrome cell adhesion molecule-like protein Dscam2 [Nymphon striatum]|nr:Down syndrome cell adhesion molecule-like protein Dscam2 [Nymphon striatum]